MSRVVLTAELASQLHKNLLSDERETCAVLLGRSVYVEDRLARIVVRELVNVSHDAYSRRNRVAAQLRPEFVANVVARAQKNDQSVIFVHTHPFGYKGFSNVDDAGETELLEFIRRRIPSRTHAALLVTPDSMHARSLGTDMYLRVAGVGRRLLWFDDMTSNSVEPQFDRQVRLFGVDGQRLIRSLRVAIVGLGGTGSVVLQQLLYLGVRDLLLIDPDVVEETNLNRLVGSVPTDVNKPKVSVARSWAHRISPSVTVEARQESVLREATARLLLDTDFVFCCTDSEGSRAVLNQLAYQYLVPMIDMGVVIAANEGQIANIAGRTQLLAPGLPCLTCANLLDAEQIRRDLLTDFERKADPYISGDQEPAPAVISLNSTMASLATTMFLNTAIGVPGNARFLNYDAISGNIRAAVCIPHSACIVCSSRGALARADEWPLPARQD
jgi:molybdopterin/thiamine biosynthesis adenylyltransferase